MADDHARLAVEAGQAADDGLVVGKAAVAVELFEVGEDVLDVVQGVRPLRVAGHDLDLARSLFQPLCSEIEVGLKAHPESRGDVIKQRF